MSRQRSQRGSALLLATLVIAALLTIGSVVWLRLGVANERRPPRLERLQTLWLARSATLSRSGATRFELAGRSVVVTPRAGGSTARFGEATATVEARWGDHGPVAWRERYDDGAGR